MKIYIGADHGGFHLKEQVEMYLKQHGYDAEDEGNNILDPDDDYPQFAAKVATNVLSSKDSDARGILVCSGAQGVAIAANRHKGIRASVVWDAHEARMTRNDNDSNILCLPGRIMNDKPELWQGVVETWLATPFSHAPRHRRRVEELDKLG
ncbi:RpiB/LacA/LacB family sugar-phosphate isomerase [Candidatus Saccharibacteria bacterium]|nr:RpiB/LacA/LacB family sugar-phosphate isomerase [Candidatus Saccharibacteria bacterium]